MSLGHLRPLAAVLALLVAYIVVRGCSLVDALGFLAMAPFVIPGIVMAIGFYAAYAGPPLSLYGSALLIILAFASRFLPIAYASSQAAIRAVHPEMEEAARILGSGRLHAIRRVTAPLLKTSLLGGWLVVFIVASRELSAAIFLVGPRTRTMSVLLYDLTEQGNFEVVSAFGGISRHHHVSSDRMKWWGDSCAEGIGAAPRTDVLTKAMAS